ncbi:AraC family transcriptional regulator [Streptomyces sp. NPDC057963]|uniref:helix-turn-helix transcriptional regulator n=1 Tax=Streptomyces sp. NPDC057963 TaxID=3346290 RepID=UPI0036EBA306
MTPQGSSPGQDELENANASAPATTGRRRRAPAGRVPRGRARRRYRAVDRPAVPETTPAGDVPALPRTGGRGLKGRHRVELGPVSLSLLRPPMPPAAVEMEGRHADGLPRIWHLVFATSGPLNVARDQRLVRLESGSVVLWEPSERFRLSAGAAGLPVRALVLHIPEAALPLPGEVLRDVSGRPAPTGSGPGALLASFLYGLAAHAPSAQARHTEWLGAAAVSLATAFLDSETVSPQGEPLPAHPRPALSATDLLLRDIKAYIEHHLCDTDLSPTSIAAANHISLRYVHHLFQRDGRTVSAFLRERRLEHCRADLSDPAQSQRSVCEIARRWGFRDPAVFNRTFKSAFGVTPGAYRDQRVR